MTPGQRIKHLRIERGLTLERVCALTGGQLGTSTLSRIETGASEDPHPSHKAAIAEALGCKVSAIWPPPQSFEDKADARFRATIKAHAERVERDGSLEERQTLGKRMLQVLEHINRGALEPGAADGPYEDLWKLALSLICDPEKRTMTIADPDGNVGREFDYFTHTTQARIVDAKRRRIQAQRGTRAKAHASAAAVPTRPRARERHDSTRSSRGSPSDDDGEHEPARGRSQKRAPS